jgi:hypothetical protein
MSLITQVNGKLANATRNFGVPLHRLGGPGWVAWEASPIARRAIASALLKLYTGGVGIVCPQPMWLAAMVSPRGTITDCPRPWRIIEFWETANQLGAAECFCQSFVDHETGHPWRERHNPHGFQSHHPLCQYEPVALQNFVEVAPLGRRQRPDNWEANRHMLREKHGLA